MSEKTLKFGDTVIIGYTDWWQYCLALCIVLAQMSAYIKHFDGGRKNMSFKIEDDNVFSKYTEIWNKIKKILSIRFHSHPIYYEKYIKTEIKTFNDVIKIVFSESELNKAKDINHYTCITAINTDSVMK